MRRRTRLFRSATKLWAPMAFRWTTAATGAKSQPCSVPVLLRLFFRSFVMSAPSKHNDALDDSERPAKKVRLEDHVDEDVDEDEGASSKAQVEPQKASDLYLDTVRVSQFGVVYIVAHSLLRLIELYWTSISRKYARCRFPTSTSMVAWFAASTSRDEDGIRTRSLTLFTMTTTCSSTLRLRR